MTIERNLAYFGFYTGIYLTRYKQAYPCKNIINCILATVESISGRILYNTYKLNIHFSHKFLNEYPFIIFLTNSLLTRFKDLNLIYRLSYVS